MSVLGVGSRVDHPAFGKGVVIAIHQEAYDVCFMIHGIKMVGKTYDQWEVIEAIEAEMGVSFSDMEKSLIRVLKSYNALEEVIDLGDKWRDGTMILKPGEEGLKSKEIPIDVFFKKIVMVRDRLRVMEQRINSSNLTNEEKVNLEQYLTRIYGSLTTFNVLFKNKGDQFTGSRS